ncbi:MAG: glucuronosyltransferase [Planctomycetes bacterium]|nr:glucuronosyltransferase [Planctomycetota bacterium]
MIFVTVGSQMPFDRLVRAVDDWAGEHTDSEVFAQVGDSEYRPLNVRWTSHLDPGAFQAQVLTADVVVGHAGTGTILEALRLGKPVVVLPRRGHLMETRDDHQLATAGAFASTQGIYVANTLEDLRAHLDLVGGMALEQPAPSHAPECLLAVLRQFVSRGT